MVGNSTRVQSSDPSSGALEDINDPRFAHYRYLRSRAAKADNGTDEPAPLFLSSQAEEHNAAGRPNGLFTPSRILTGLFAGSVVAMGFALFSVDAARDIIVNAKATLEASLMSVSAVQAKAAVADAAQVQPVTHDVPVAKPDQPSRDEIAAAYQAAIKSQIVIQEAPPAAPAPPVAPAAAPSIRHLDADELAALLKRARGLLAIGDIASARLLLERAADAQEADAALTLARTYDPEVLGTSDARSVTADPAKARNWYRKAAELGSQLAQQRLAGMQN
jgi:hypothetical protein